MKPLHLVKFTFVCLLASAVFLPSCTKNSEVYVYPGNNPANIPTLIDIHLTSSASSSDFSKVIVDLQELEYNYSNEAGVADGWEKINLPHTGTVNLMDLLHGESVKLNSEAIPGDVRQLRLR